jgi:uncharacterized repeat protein (TIGR03803 family)
MRASGSPLSLKLRQLRNVGIIAAFCAALALASPAQTLTTVYDFCSQPNCADGFFPVAEVMQGTDGNFYGTTQFGGAYHLQQGTVFKLTPSGTLTTLHSFCSQGDCVGDGGQPYAGLVQATDGNFYGTTLIGGGSAPPGAGGTIFKVTPDGTFTTFYTFCPQIYQCPNGADPSGTLVQGTDGNLYGTTQGGGTNPDCYQGVTCGTVFKITLDGTLTTLHSFNGADGSVPFDGLVQATDGNFYGTTKWGGANLADCGNGLQVGCGTVFKITPDGTFTSLYSFCSQPNCSDGYWPYATLVQGTDGNLYGTTLYTCNGDCGGGSVFKITPSGTLTTLHTFTGGVDGQAPWAGLIQATDGNFYGTASLGGANGDGGTVFQITPSGTFTTLYSFCSLQNCADGKTPIGRLVQATDGTFYGTTYYGGTNPDCSGNACGTVFRLAAGLSPTNWQFVPVAPCRVVDTRGPNGPFGGPPIQGGLFRSFAIPQQPDCNIPSSAVAYSLNVTVVPHGPLGYLTIWPTGRPQPYVSTMNSPDGRIKANAAIVPAGGGGGVNVYVTDTTDVVLDIDGYFAPAGQNTLDFYPLTPCRVVDTRRADFPSGLGAPSFGNGEARELPVLTNSPCLQGLPNQPLAYSFNVTADPHPAGQQLNYLTIWPSDQQQPYVSTLNNPTATVVANAAIVPAAANGDVSVFTYNSTDVIIDVNGYFAASTQGGLSLHAVVPCRAYDSRSNNGQPFSGERTVNIINGPCAPPNAQAYVFNATVVPNGFLDYLTLWPDSENQPIVSTLNAYDGLITTNMAVVPNINGSIDAYASQLTQLILDISGYFAP